MAAFFSMAAAFLELTLLGGMLVVCCVECVVEGTILLVACVCVVADDEAGAAVGGQAEAAARGKAEDTGGPVDRVVDAWGLWREGIDWLGVCGLRSVGAFEPFQR